MSKIANIKKAVAEGKGSVKMIEYLLWYVESQQKQIAYMKQIDLSDKKQAYLDANFPNWIGNKRDEVDQSQITPKEYEAWFKVAEESHNFIIVKDQRVPRKNS